MTVYDQRTGLPPELIVVGPAFFEAFVPEGVRPAAGTEIFVDSIGIGLGGALNSASVAAVLGVSVSFMFPRTSWLVDGAIERLCQMTGITPVPFGNESEHFVSLVFRCGADRAFVSSGDWSVFSNCPDIGRCRRVHVGGLSEFFLLEGQIENLKRHDVRISCCAGWAPPSLDRLRLIDDCPLSTLFLNRDEADYLFGGIEETLERMVGRVARDVIVTLGPDGAIGIVAGKPVKARAPQVEVVDPTGAGDAFAAAWLTALIKSERPGSAAFDPVEAMSAACAVASMITGMRGGVVTDVRQVTSR